MLDMYNTTRDFDKTGHAIAVLPVGALEQHGSHLPRRWILGFPEAASAEKGKRMMDIMLECALDYLQDINLQMKRAGKMMITVRLLSESDIPFAMTLKNLAGWNQVEKDWKGYLDFETKGCFLAEVNGESAGTATAIDYENRFGWVGMVLVHPTKRRIGLGTILLKKAISYLQENNLACVKLDATQMGKKVYVPLGFEDEFEIKRYQGQGLAKSPTTFVSSKIKSVTEEYMHQLILFDAYYFGASRGRVLRSLHHRNPQCSFLYQTDDGKIAGYIMAHRGFEAFQIGPWVAKDQQTAKMLFQSVLNRIEGSVFLDVPCLNHSGLMLMKEHSFEVQRVFYRMFLGENRYPGRSYDIYATSGAEKG